MLDTDREVDCDEVTDDVGDGVQDAVRVIDVVVVGEADTVVVTV